jgi:hypothetical protein
MRVTASSPDQYQVELAPINRPGANYYRDTITITASRRREWMALRAALLPIGDGGALSMAAREEALCKYQDSLRETLCAQNFERSLADAGSSVELVLDGTLETEFLETLTVVGTPLGLISGVSRLSLTDALPVRPRIGPTRRLSALVIGDPSGDLPLADLEARRVARALRASGLNVKPLRGADVTREELRKAFTSAPGPWLVHYAGHVNEARGGWQVNLHGTAVPAEDFVGLVCTQPVVLAFINGCASIGQPQPDSPIPGFGALFLQHDVPCIGTHFPVQDGSALRFAIAFYQAFLPPRGRARGESLAEAVLQARQAIRGESWFNYLAFGKPGFHLQFHRPTPG